MNNSYLIFSRSRLRLDIRVWFTMLLLSLLSIVILSSVLFMDSNDGFEIFTNGANKITCNIFFVGEIVSFSIDGTIKVDDKFEWDFKDGSLQHGVNTQHCFLKAGKFSVTLTRNNNFQTTIKIIILAKAKKEAINQYIEHPLNLPDTNIPVMGKSSLDDISPMPESSIHFIPSITNVFPLSAEAGAFIKIIGEHFNGLKSVSFGGYEAHVVSNSCSKSKPDILVVKVGAGGSGNIVVQTQSGSASFVSPFTYIQAASAAPQVETSKPEHKMPSISIIKQYLQAVIDSDKNAQDFQVFFSSNINVLNVYVNGNSFPDCNFLEFCEYIHGKKIKIVDVNVNINPANNCELGLNVKCEDTRKGLSKLFSKQYKLHNL